MTRRIREHAGLAFNAASRHCERAACYGPLNPMWAFFDKLRLKYQKIWYEKNNSRS